MNKDTCERVVRNIRAELKSYLEKSKLKALVIGESGGIDSALCSALARPVCDQLQVALLGRSITIESNKQDEIDRGAAIGAAFCTDFEAVNLTDVFPYLKNSCEFSDEPQESLLYKLRQGNIKARMRMIYLYDLAQKHTGMVISTDNLTEYYLGFWTLHGDVGDFGLIQGLWKMEVYALAQYLVNYELESDYKRAALQACIDATPCDGLGISNTDLDQLGASSYAEVDVVLKSCLDGTIKDRDHQVAKKYYGSMYKRHNPFNLLREQLFK